MKTARYEQLVLIRHYPRGLHIKQAFAAHYGSEVQSRATVEGALLAWAKSTMIRRFLTLVFAITMLGAEPKTYAQSKINSASDGCWDAYRAQTLPDAAAALLALQHQCELALQYRSKWRMDLDKAELRLALLRIHIALHSINASDRALPKTIGPDYFAGDAVAILATIYKGKDTRRYDAAIIRAAWLAANSQIRLKYEEATIREAILIYVARGDYKSANRLIPHLEEPVLSNQTENGQLLIDLLQGRHASYVRDAIVSLANKWGADHVAILGPIDYVIAETYKSEDRAKYLQWLNVAERNDFEQASAELNRLFFDFKDYHPLVGALRALGYDDGFTSAGDDVDQAALLKNVAAFGTAALGSGLDYGYYTLQNKDLITKLRIFSQSVHRVSPAQFPAVGKITKLDTAGALQSTGFLAYDNCTVVTALHALGGKLDDPTSFYLDLPLPNGKAQRSQIRVVAMGMGTAIPTRPANDWLVGKLEPCAPGNVKAGSLLEQDRSFDSSDNTFAFELSKNPVIYFAVGFPGGTAERALIMSPCILSQRLGYTLTFNNTCYLHGMSGGPVYASNVDNSETQDVAALNTELGQTLDQSIMSNATVTATQRGVGTLSAVFADAAWRASHFENPDVTEVALVDAQIMKLRGGSGERMSASQRSSFVSHYLETHVPPELSPFWYFFADLDKIGADAFLELTGGMMADTSWLPGVWCSDVGKLTISADNEGHWSLAYFETKGPYEPPVIVGNAIIFRSSAPAVNHTDFILRRRGSDLYLAGFWKGFGSGDPRAENWVHIRTSKQCSGKPVVNSQK